MSGAPADRLELSPEAASYDPAAIDDPQFQERMERIRAQILDGTYLTPDKLDVVADRLWTALNSPPPPEWYSGDQRLNPPPDLGTQIEVVE